MATFRPGKPSIAVGQLVDTLMFNGAPVVWTNVFTSDGWIWPNPNNYEIVVPKSGLYLYGFSYATGIPNVNTLVSAQTLVNGVQRGPRDRPGTSTNAPRGGGAQFLEELQTGDTIALTFSIGGGAIINTQAVHCQLYACRVGPLRWT